MSRETRTRLEGVKQIATTASRQNPIVDNVLNAKEYYEGTYKALKGRKLPSVKELLRDLPPAVRAMERKR